MKHHDERKIRVNCGDRDIFKKKIKNRYHSKFEKKDEEIWYLRQQKSQVRVKNHKAKKEEKAWISEIYIFFKDGIKFCIIQNLRRINQSVKKRTYSSQDERDDPEA